MAKATALPYAAWCREGIPARRGGGAPVFIWEYCFNLRAGNVAELMTAHGPLSGSTTMSDSIDLANAFATGLSGIAAALLAWAAYRVADGQASVDRHQLRRDYHEGIRNWADECTMSLHRALALCEMDPPRTMDPPFRIRQLQAMAELRGLIDRGRWLLPNERAEEVGGHKPAAFRGYRHPALDSLVRGYQIVAELDYIAPGANRPKNEAMVRQIRDFVSDIQEVLETRAWGRLIDELRRR